VTTHNINIQDGGLGKVITDAMSRLGALGGPGGTSVKGGGGGKVEEAGPTESTQKEIALSAEQQVKSAENMKGFMGRLGKTLGIQVGLSSILKQSQIFTGTIGSIFQIFGALVDVILAPFLPIIVPAIRMLAGMIPLIYSYTSKIGAWIQENLTVEKVDEVFKAGIERIFTFLESFLPEWMTRGLKETLLGVSWGTIVKNIALGAILMVFARKFGFFKLLAPLGKILTKIPFFNKLFVTLWAKLANLGIVIAKALLPGFGKFFGKGAVAKGAAAAAAAAAAKTAAKGGKANPLIAKANREAAAKAASAAKGAGGGMFSKFAPKNIAAAAKAAGPKGLLKLGAKKLIPGLSAAFLAYEGAKGAIEVFNANMKADKGLWKSLGKAGVVAGTAGAAVGLSFVPGMGLVAPIAGSIATGMVRDKMMPTNITLNVDGKEVTKLEIEDDKIRINRADSGAASPQVNAGINPQGTN